MHACTCAMLAWMPQGLCAPDAVPVNVTVVDSCATCSLNIPATEFALLAPTSIGNLAVAVQQARMRRWF